MGTLPLFGSVKAATKTWGVLFEPNSLAPASHNAVVAFRFDFDCLGPPFGVGECDGVFETVGGSFAFDFEVLPNP